jgi:hypothetical protein
MELIKEQQSIVSVCVSEINNAPNPHKANSHRKQYIKEIDILIEIIEAFNKITKPYLEHLRSRCESHLSS